MATSNYLRKMRRFTQQQESEKSNYDKMTMGERSSAAWALVKSGEAKTIKEAWSIIKSR